LVETDVEIEGDFSKPTWRDILLFQIIISPYSIGKWIMFQV